MTLQRGGRILEITCIQANNEKKERLRVAAYCRVSKDDEEQASSLMNQTEHYKTLIQSTPEYEYAGLYFDQGVSGYIENRPGFQKMMTDARAGRFDLIITKSITRFARNTNTILKATRELKELGIGVFFELQNMNTLTQAGELLMTLYAALGEGERQNYRELALLQKQRRFEDGKPLYQLYKAFGYREGQKSGTFEVQPEEAKIIKQIYKWVRDEYAIATILKKLKEAGYHTRTGKDFNQSLIYGIVRSVINKGDYIMHRTYRDENRKMYFNQKVLKSWYIENDHPAIVTKKLWAEANEVLDLRAAERVRPVPILPMTEENYPYKNKIFCGYCGQRLYHVKAKTCLQYTFYCRKKNKNVGKCCPGISVPQKVIESWGEITENIYITHDPDKPIPKMYSYVKESVWKKDNEKKIYFGELKPYTKENFHYYRRIFCEKCGWPLYRIRRDDGKIEFICGGKRTHLLSFCEGIIVPEEVLDRLPEKDGYFLIKEESIDGEKHYSYSCRSQKPERKRKEGKKEN